MTLFCASIRIDSVSLSYHVQVFSCEISLVCSLKWLYTRFSSHFCCLVVVLSILVLFVLFLVTVINLSLLFLMQSLHLIDVSTLTSMLASFPPSFLDTYCHEFSYFLVHLLKFFFRPHQEWPRVSFKWVAQVFITLILLYSLVSSSFLVLLRYFFFFHLHFQYSQVFFSEHPDFFLIL